MTSPYYADDLATLFLGDCREITEWLAADVLVTDPPYGIGWKRGAKQSRGDKGSPGIAGDTDTSTRDAALDMWGNRPGVVFGSFYAPAPPRIRQWLAFRKGVDSGVVGSTTGFRRDLEPVFLVGPWPQRAAQRTSLIWSNAIGTAGIATRYRHPHAKPVDVMEQLIQACPPGAIADPFAGAGSTLVAARNLGRHVIGVEVEERHCERTALRLSQLVLEFGGAA